MDCLTAVGAIVSQPSVTYLLRSRCSCATPRPQTFAKQRLINAIFGFALVIGIGIGTPGIAAADAAAPQQPGFITTAYPPEPTWDAPASSRLATFPSLRVRTLAHA